MKRFLLVLLILTSCSNKEEQSAETTTAPEEIKDTIDVVVEEDTYSIWTDPCVNCDWYFCEDLSEVWRKQICMNECNDPKTL